MEPAVEVSGSNVSTRPVDRLLVVRLGSMGDIVHTLPAVAALRRVFPESEFGWVIEERWTELLCTPRSLRSGPRNPQRPLIDYIHAVDTKTWRKSLLSAQTWERVAAGLSELRARKYQVAVDFQGALRSALISRWSGAPIVYGAVQPRENVASMFYTRQVMAKGEHVVRQNLALAAAFAGNTLPLPPVSFPVDAASDRSIAERLRSEHLERFALLNPGAGWGAKQWPAERYGEVARKLAVQGLLSLVNFGPGEEELAETVEKASANTAKRIECTISELIAVTRHARVFIGGDTGPMHLAAALRVPVVAVFGPTNPARNGPFGTRSIVLRSPSSATSHARRTQPDAGLLEITSDQVAAAANRLLGSCRG